MTALHSTSSTAIAPRTDGALALRPTILGATATRIPVGGRIRAGIMVLKRSAAEDGKARAIYAAGVEAGKCFEDIEREICEAVPALSSPLTPKNVPFFTVRAADFPNAGVAKMIIEKFGEDRGDGVRLYRFPVVFPADAWQTVMPHELVTWTASGKQFWSEYSDDGSTRYCKTYAPVPTDRNGRRALRTFGGRKVILRAERQGVCDPERCPQYQQRQCNLSGRFIFYIPGIQSLGAFELPTNSFYAMQHAIEKFQTIAFMRGGRISGFLDGRQSTFFITKRRVEVSRIGDDGRPTRVAQWLIELEAPIDVTALLRPEDESEMLAHQRRAAEAVVILEGHEGKTADRPADVGTVREERVIDNPDAAAFAPACRREAAPAAAQPDAAAPAPAAPVTRTTDRRNGVAGRTEQQGVQGGMSATQPPSVAAERDLAWIYDGAAALGVARERFELYAEKRWGRGWAVAAAGRKRAIDEVNAFADDPDGFRVKVNAEVEVFS